MITATAVGAGTAVYVAIEALIALIGVVGSYIVSDAISKKQREQNKADSAELMEQQTKISKQMNAEMYQQQIEDTQELTAKQQELSAQESANLTEQQRRMSINYQNARYGSVANRRSDAQSNNK